MPSTIVTKIKVTPQNENPAIQCILKSLHKLIPTLDSPNMNLKYDNLLNALYHPFGVTQDAPRSTLGNDP
jgi:hypothetical protein